MNRVLRVALREFTSTALTPGFIIGALVVPVLFVPIIILIGYLMANAEPPAEQGIVAVLDRTGRIVEPLQGRLSPEAIAERRQEITREVAKKASEALPIVSEEQINKAAEQANQLASVPKLQIELIESPGSEDAIEGILEAKKDQLRQPADREDPSRLVAFVIIDEHAVEPRIPIEQALEQIGDEESEPAFGTYELYQRPKVDSRTIGEIRSGLSWAIRDQRYRAAEVDRDKVDLLSNVRAPDSQEVTAQGTRTSSGKLQALIPFAVIFLLFMGVLTGGQYLLTTTIEEKSSRVVELLLAAVSPMQLMAGKIFGQLGVGLSLLVIYNAMGLVALTVFNRADLISTSTLVYMLIFFLLSYIQIGGFMAAIGSAVTELREAQSLMTPVMLILVFSFYLSMPVAQDPDATYAVVLSFIPPVSPFVMLTRIASTEPPPMWQPIVAVLINVVGAYASIWAAAKIFRIGLLMFGKPPNIKTLIKWVAMA